MCGTKCRSIGHLFVALVVIIVGATGYQYTDEPVTLKGDVDVLDEDQIALLQKVFFAFDTQKKGFITPDAVGTIFTMVGCTTAFTKETLQKAIAEIDEEGSGQIEFEEFAHLAAKFCFEGNALGQGLNVLLQCMSYRQEQYHISQVGVTKKIDYTYYY